MKFGDVSVGDYTWCAAGVFLHPGVTVEEVQEATGFELVIDDDLDETRRPTDEELALIRDVLDPQGLREAEVRS